MTLISKPSRGGVVSKGQPETNCLSGYEQGATIKRKTGNIINRVPEA